jgi:Flp pilus assembly protein TadB
VKILYCDDCKDISIKSRLEEDKCNRCGRPARPVPYSRPWQFYASSGILLAAAAVLFLYPIQDILVRLEVFGVALVIVLALSSWSIRSLRSRILKRVQQAPVVEAKP